MFSAYQIFLLLLLQAFLALLIHCTRNKASSAKQNTFVPNLGRRSQAKVHVYVLAGQSNMEGHGEIDSVDKDGNQKNGTLMYQLHDPRTRDEFKILWDDETQDWKKLSNVKVWFQEGKKSDGINGSNIPGENMDDYTAGDLTVGFGSGGAQDLSFIGPEFGFGYNIEIPKGDKIVLIKTAWGGRDLAQKFRPPSSAGVYDPYCQLPDCDPFQVGHYYMVMLQDVSKLLQPGVLGKIYPDLKGMPAEIAGFGWHQGWNDGCDVNMTAAYETNLVHLIKDLRRAWNKPHLPVSIGVTGFSGWETNGLGRTPPDCRSGPNASTINCHCDSKVDRTCTRIDIILAQFAAANLTKHPDLECCVEAVETRGFWRPVEYSPMNQGYHWNHNAETHYLIGKSMAEAMNRARKEKEASQKRKKRQYQQLAVNNKERKIGGSNSTIS